jgi:GNAT superfamily N-acetyltransferase
MSAEISISAVDPEGDPARYCISEYYRELNERSNGGFDPAAGISAEPHELVPPHGCLLVAFRDEEPVGCGAVKFHPGEPAELKRMWVSPDARGLGLGRRLLEELEQLARASGATVAHIETNENLVEAIALYRSAGWIEVAPFNDEPFAHHWFEKRL